MESLPYNRRVSIRPKMYTYASVKVQSRPSIASILAKLGHIKPLAPQNAEVTEENKILCPTKYKKWIELLPLIAICI